MYVDDKSELTARTILETKALVQLRDTSWREGKVACYNVVAGLRGPMRAGWHHNILPYRIYRRQDAHELLLLVITLVYDIIKAQECC